MDEPPPLPFEPPLLAATGIASTSAEATVVPDLPLPPTESPVAPETIFPFEFFGHHREYFRIWITNTFLTLITFGVYAAWAKVRRKRYFYGHTRLGGFAFDYTADPKRLLLGNIVVVSLFLGYAFFGSAYAQVKFATLGLSTLVVPWLIVRALSFNARNTVHRGIPLRFRGKYGMALLVYVGMLILSVATLGAMYPCFAFGRKQFAIDHLRYGDSCFHFEARLSGFYMIYLKVFLSALGLFFFYCILVSAARLALGDQRPVAVFLRGNTLFTYANAAAVLIMLNFLKLQIKVATFNYSWNHTRLDDHRFRANLSFWKLLRIQIINTLAIVGTAGLAYPWTEIRTARYTLSRLVFLPHGSLEEVKAFGRSGAGALGDAATDFFGVDLGL